MKSPIEGKKGIHTCSQHRQEKPIIPAKPERKTMKPPSFNSTIK